MEKLISLQIRKRPDNSEENKYMDIVTANSNGATIVANNYLQEESFSIMMKSIQNEKWMV